MGLQRKRKTTSKSFERIRYDYLLIVINNSGQLKVSQKLSSPKEDFYTVPEAILQFMNDYSYSLQEKLNDEQFKFLSRDMIGTDKRFMQTSFASGNFYKAPPYTKVYINKWMHQNIGVDILHRITTTKQKSTVYLSNRLDFAYNSLDCVMTVIINYKKRKIAFMQNFIEQNVFFVLDMDKDYPYDWKNIQKHFPKGSVEKYTEDFDKKWRQRLRYLQRIDRETQWGAEKLKREFAFEVKNNYIRKIEFL